MEKDENPFFPTNKNLQSKSQGVEPSIPFMLAIEKPKREIFDKRSLNLYTEILGYKREGFEIIYGVPPSKSNSYRIVTFKSKDPNKKSYSHLAKTKELKQYEKDFLFQCRLFRNAKIDCDFSFEADVFYPSRRADLDGCLKATLDCLQQAGAITNDNLCQDIHIKRHIDKLHPRIEFKLTKCIPTEK